MYCMSIPSEPFSSNSSCRTVRSTKRLDIAAGGSPTWSAWRGDNAEGDTIETASETATEGGEGERCDPNLEFIPIISFGQISRLRRRLWGSQIWLQVAHDKEEIRIQKRPKAVPCNYGCSLAAFRSLVQGSRRRGSSENRRDLSRCSGVA